METAAYSMYSNFATLYRFGLKNREHFESTNFEICCWGTVAITLCVSSVQFALVPVKRHAEIYLQYQ